MAKNIPNPKAITIVAHTYCTYSCLFCSRRLGKRKKDWWSFEKVTEGLKDVWKDAALANIGGCGEIGQLPYFNDLLDFFREHNIKVQFTSNGYYLDVPRIRQGLIDLITISLHTIDEPTYDILTGTKDHLPQVIKNIKLLAQKPRDYKLHIVAVTTNLNVSQAPAIAQFCKNLGVDMLRFIPLVDPLSIGLPNGYDEGVTLQETPENFALLEDACRITDEHCLIPIVAEKRESIIAKKMRTCNDPFELAIIGHNGRVVPCCDLSIVDLGNVFEAPWEEIWNGEKFQSFRASVKDGTNKDCLQHCRKWG